MSDFFLTKYCVFILHLFSNNSRCHCIICVSALMDNGKEKWAVNGDKYFYRQKSRMLRMILPFTSDNNLYLQDFFYWSFLREELFFFLSFFLWGGGMRFEGWRPTLPLFIWPYKEGQDWRITGNVLSLVLFSLFFLLLFIDGFIVLSFGMGLETKQGWFNVKERRLNEKYMK